MYNLSFIGRLAKAAMVGVITWIILTILGMLVGRFLDPTIGALVENVAVALGFLVAVYYFCFFPKPLF